MKELSRRSAHTPNSPPIPEIADAVQTTKSAGWKVSLPTLEEPWRENRLLASLRQHSFRSWVLRCGMAVGAVAAGWGLRLVTEAWVGPGLPTYVTFYPAVMAVALLAGIGSGLLATALAGLTAALWILPPEGMNIASPVDRLGLVIFISMGTFMSVVAELYGRSRTKAAAYDREAVLRETRREKEFLANLLEHADQPFAVGYPDGRIGLLNRAYEQLTGFTADELRKIDWSVALTPPEWRELEKRKLEELHRAGQPVRYEKEYIRKDGTRVPVELLVHLVTDEAGKPEYYYSFLTDITDRKRVEQELRESEERRKVAEVVRTERERFNNVLDMMPAYVILLSPDYRVPFANRFFEDRFGKSEGRRCFEYLFQRSEPCENCETYKVLKTGAPHRWEWTGPDGRNYDIYDFPFTDVDGSPFIMEVGLDITERKRAEAALRVANETLEQRVAKRTAELAESAQRIHASLAEKEVLLKEIHHRVKNNMQVISSLVDLQADQLQDEAMRAVLQDVTHRVRSMALVHEKLYQSADMARVEFAEYAQSLLGYLWRAHGSAASGVRLTLDLEPVPLSVNAAVPCGLILNELASNALKHAFRGRESGEVIVSLRGGPEGRTCLRVRDNGIGLRADLDWQQSDSLGLRLVRILAKQLSATVDVQSGEGTEFSVSFGGPTV
jgi:PAS domain S-box-containing protein